MRGTGFGREAWRWPLIPVTIVVLLFDLVATIYAVVRGLPGVYSFSVVATVWAWVAVAQWIGPRLRRRASTEH
jgi:hypothetical protein